MNSTGVFVLHHYVWSCHQLWCSCIQSVILICNELFMYVPRASVYICIKGAVQLILVDFLDFLLGIERGNCSKNCGVLCLGICECSNMIIIGRVRAYNSSNRCVFIAETLTVCFGVRFSEHHCPVVVSCWGSDSGAVREFLLV